MAKTKVSNAVQSLGDHLREQRQAAQLSLRQLAEQTGISNPYLSQIERGLRRPSADVVQQLAKVLRISADQLGELGADVRGTPSVTVEDAVLADPDLTAAQRHALLEVYAAFTAPARAEREAAQQDEPDTQPDTEPDTQPVDEPLTA
ncbi:helix-turn-helix domain-containing protein [Nocardioidaceae bacterium]|nr:helix-turn-helix domain-containing protein [Nocardioidaceae bacterium]